ncbi:MAG: hypothetical protein ACO1RT_13430 [Planctomycetaceae bacterium]
MSVDNTRERFDSAAITLVVISAVLWGVLNWPYPYQATAHQYTQSPALADYSFETFLFPHYEMMRAGFPFVYSLRFEDDLASRPELWSPLALAANIAIAVLTTALIGCGPFWVRRHFATRDPANSISPAYRLAIQVGLGSAAIGTVAAVAVSVLSRDAREYDLVRRLAFKGAVHRYALVPRPLARAVPGFVLQRFSRIRGVMTWDRSPATMSEILAIPTLKSFSSYATAPSPEQLLAPAVQDRLNHLQLRAVELDEPLKDAIMKLRKLRDLDLAECSGLDSGLGNIEGLSRLTALDFSDSDIRLSSLPSSDWPKNLKRLHLSRPPRGSDSLVLRSLPSLESLSVCRTDASYNESVVQIELADMPQLEYLGIETLQKFSLQVDSAPRLTTIGFSDPEIGLRVRSQQIVPISLWLQSLRLRDLPSLRSLALDGLDLEELSLNGTPNLTRLSIGRFGYNSDIALRPYDESKKPLIQWLIQSLGRCDGPANIDLSSLPLEGLDLKPLTQNDRIRSLSLRGCGISGDQLRVLGKLPRLAQIDLRGCPITDQEAMAMLRGGLPLKEFLVSSGDFEFIEVVNQPKLRGFIATESPRVKRVHISDSPQLQAELILGDSVEELRIRDGHSLLGLAVDGPLPAGTELHGLQSLRFFAVGGARADDELCRHLWQCADLDHLTIAYGRLSEKSLAKIGRFAKLTVLALPGSKVNDDIVRRHWAGLKLLSDVNLSETEITSESLQQLISLKNIQKLAINHCKVEKKDLRDLVKIDQLIELDVAGIGLDADTMMGCLRRGMLDRLNVSYSYLDDAAIEVLASSCAKSLIFLGLRGCGLDEATVRRIADRHPRLAMDVANNELSEAFVNELRQQNRLLDQHDRDGFLRHLSDGEYERMADIKAEFDPVRGRINSYQFIATNSAGVGF